MNWKFRDAKIVVLVNALCLPLRVFLFANFAVKRYSTAGAHRDNAISAHQIPQAFKDFIFYLS
jgi:predicted DCC family thiol-disulfide oxidoreductase YuxK